MAASRACGHDPEDLLVLGRDLLADEADPRQIAVDGPRFVQLGPQVDEDEIALFHRRIVGAGGRLVVRVAAVRADADDRRMVRNEMVLLEVVEDAPLHLGFAHRAVAADALGDEGEGDGVGRVGVLRRLQVHGPLLVVPAGLEPLDQVARRHDLDAGGAHQLDGAGVHPRDVGVGVARHVLHRHAAGAGRQGRDAGLQFLPAQVLLAAPGRWSRACGSMRCTSFWGSPFGGDEVEPAPRQHGVGRQVQDAAGQHVEAAEVVEQPAVQAEVAKGGLHGSEVEHGSVLSRRRADGGSVRKAARGGRRDRRNLASESGNNPSLAAERAAPYPFHYHLLPAKNGA